MSIWTTPERLQLRKTVRSFAEREILPHVDEWEQAGELPRDLSRKAAAAGLLGVGQFQGLGRRGNGGSAAVGAHGDVLHLGGRHVARGEHPVHLTVAGW